MLMKKMVSAVALTAMVGACAGRDPNPVGVVQNGDQFLDCNAIQAQVLANDNQLRALGKESSSTTGSNVALAVVGGLLFWPALFAMDLKHASDKETSALEARQGYLGSIAAQKGCGGLHA